MTKSTFMRLDGDRSRLAAGRGAGCGSSGNSGGTGSAGTTGTAGTTGSRHAATSGDAGTSGGAGTSGAAGTVGTAGTTGGGGRRRQAAAAPPETRVAAAPPETRAAAAAPDAGRGGSTPARTGSAGTVGTGGAAMPSAGCGTTPTTTAETTFMIDVSGTSRSYIVTLAGQLQRQPAAPAGVRLARPHRHRDADRARQLLRPQVAHDQRDLRRAPGSRHHHRSDRHRLAEHQRSGHRVPARDAGLDEHQLLRRSGARVLGRLQLRRHHVAHHRLPDERHLPRRRADRGRDLRPPELPHPPDRRLDDARHRWTPRRRAASTSRPANPRAIESWRSTTAPATTAPADPSPCVAYQGCDAGYPVQWCPHDGAHVIPSFAAAAIANFFLQF